MRERGGGQIDYPCRPPRRQVACEWDVIDDLIPRMSDRAVGRAPNLYGDGAPALLPEPGRLEEWAAHPPPPPPGTRPKLSRRYATDAARAAAELQAPAEDGGVGGEARSVWRRREMWGLVWVEQVPEAAWRRRAIAVVAVWC
jgi:hypothetical protein